VKAALIAPVVLLACAALLASGEVAAQARGGAAKKKEGVAVDPVVGRIDALADMDTWLRRLAGRFRITVIGQPIGEADCVGIGTGSGVHCIYRFARPGWEDRWGVQVRMFGLDLDAPGINYLRLNGDSTAEGGVTKLRGDTISFIGDCPVVQPERSGPVIVTVLNCWQELQMHAPRGRNIRIRNRIHQYQMISVPGGRPSRANVSFTQEWQLERVR